MNTSSSIISTTNVVVVVSSSYPIRTITSTSSSSSSSSSHHHRSFFFSSLKYNNNNIERHRRLLSSVGKYRIRCGGGASAIKEIDETQFEGTVLKSDRPVLVEFVASWCGPCRLISPAIDWLAKEYSDRLTVVKIDHDANPKLIEEYKVYGLPALILFKNGKEIPESRREGAITKVKLKEYVDTLLESISVS